MTQARLRSTRLDLLDAVTDPDDQGIAKIEEQPGFQDARHRLELAVERRQGHRSRVNWQSMIALPPSVK